MKILKPEFVNALRNFIAARSHGDEIENFYLRRRIVLELEYQANFDSSQNNLLVLFSNQTNPKGFTSGYQYEVEIGGDLYTIIAKLDDYTGTRWSDSRDSDGSLGEGK